MLFIIISKIKVIIIEQDALENPYDCTKRMHDTASFPLVQIQTAWMTLVLPLLKSGSLAGAFG